MKGDGYPYRYLDKMFVNTIFSCKRDTFLGKGAKAHL
jgi:hypothetical protein